MTGSRGRTPRLRMFAGPNGSGKSCLKDIVESEGLNLGVYVNADEIEKTLRADGFLQLEDFKVDLTDEEFLQGFAVVCEERSKTVPVPKVSCVDGRVKFLVEELNSYHAAMIAELFRYTFLQKGISFTFETVMSHPSKVAFLKQAKEKGFRVYLYFIATEDPAINVARVEDRVRGGGHDVPTNKIIERYSRAIEYLPKALGVADRGYVFDNSGDDPLWVAETFNASDDEPTILELREEELPGWMSKVIEG